MWLFIISFVLLVIGTLAQRDERARRRREAAKPKPPSEPVGFHP